GRSALSHATGSAPRRWSEAVSGGSSSRSAAGSRCSAEACPARKNRGDNSWKAWGERMILAGDVGGTKCNLALYEVHGQGYRKVVQQRYESRAFSSFDEIIEKFLFQTSKETRKAGSGEIEAAGFGVAGPVIDHRVKATNLPWVVDGAALSGQLGTDHVVLLNDLEATGYSLALMKPSEISILNRGVPSPQSTQALVAAGTGLGEAILFWNGDRYVVAGSEGGHADFAPRSEREIELLRHMKKRYEFVSVELIVSGP